MTRIQISTSISPETRRKLDELLEHYGTQREVVTLAIDRLYQEHREEIMPDEIAIKNFRRSRKFGWGWSSTPTGENAYSIEVPDAPDYTGTLRQLFQDRADDVAFHSLDGAFYDTAWFYDGRGITHTWAFGPLSPMFAPDGKPIEDVKYDYRWETGFRPAYANGDDIKIRLA